MAEKTKLLITGASGFLGMRLIRHYREQYECITPSHRQLEITDEAYCMELIQQHTPDYVIHTAAISDTGKCEQEPEASYKVNVIGTENLAKACAAAGSRLLFMSSDQVYNGNHTKQPNRETDICFPVNVYGRHKLEAEQRVLKLLPDAAVLRLTWMYDLPGSGLTVKANFLTKIIESINLQQEISFSDKEYRGITNVNEVVANMARIFELPGGIYNFGSYAEESTYQLARQVYEMLGTSAARIDTWLKPYPGATPRNLAMDPEWQQQNQIYFSANSAGIRQCLLAHGSKNR